MLEGVFIAGFVQAGSWHISCFWRFDVFLEFPFEDPFLPLGC